jgi:hypothetical protein
MEDSVYVSANMSMAAMGSKKTLENQLWHN